MLFWGCMDVPSMQSIISGLRLVTNSESAT
jgi:hypothetical protein